MKKMMNITADEKYLKTFEALSSDVRLKILSLLSHRPLNIKQIASELNLSSAIITMHINKLEKGNLIESRREKVNGTVQKLCAIKVDEINVKLPVAIKEDINYHKFEIPIGHYTDFDIKPTCGLSTTEKVIGLYDDPRYFLYPERVDIGILWFAQGYVEYKLPNQMLTKECATKLEISMEISSEAPTFNEDFPSEITFFLNNIEIGKFISPGDYGERKGKYTPDWWNPEINQYGFLKIIKIDDTGTFIDGSKISDVTINDININNKYWTFRLAVLDDAKYVGGLTIFGKGFGNYDQDINFKLFYK